MREIHWEKAAESDLLEIVPIEHAVAVDAAVHRFAESRQGFLRHVAQASGPDEIRLYVPNAPHYVRIRYDDAHVYVWRVMSRT